MASAGVCFTRLSLLWSEKPGAPPAPGRGSGAGALTRRQEKRAPYDSFLQPDPPHAGGREQPLHLGLGHHGPGHGTGRAVALVDQHLHLHRGAGAAGNEPLVRLLHAGGGEAPKEPHGLHAGVVPAVRGVRAQVQLPAAVRPVMRARLEEAAAVIGRHRPQGHRLPRAQPRHPRLQPLVRRPSGGGHGQAGCPASLRDAQQGPRRGGDGGQRSPHGGGGSGCAVRPRRPQYRYRGRRPLQAAPIESRAPSPTPSPGKPPVPGRSRLPQTIRSSEP